MEIHIGCSGWYYDHWIGPFYSGTLKKSEWLEYYSQYFSIVEINSTFYNMPKEQTVRRWFDSTEDSFRFVVKGNRNITHKKRLLGVMQDTELFHALISKLSFKLKLVLWQFPGSFKMTHSTFKRLEDFCGHLSDLQLKGLFEFRDISWFNHDVLDLLKAYGTGYVLADSPDFYRKLLIPTACDTLYIRKHGKDCGFCYSYTDAELLKIAGYIHSKNENSDINDIYVIFNNDGCCSAVKDALRLKEFVNVM